MTNNILYEDISDIMKLYQSDFDETPQSKELDKTANNPLLKFKTIDIPTDQDRLMNIKDVDLPDFLKKYTIIDKEKAGDVSDY